MESREEIQTPDYLKKNTTTPIIKLRRYTVKSFFVQRPKIISLSYTFIFEQAQVIGKLLLDTHLTAQGTKQGKEAVIKQLLEGAVMFELQLVRKVIEPKAVIPPDMAMIVLTLRNSSSSVREHFRVFLDFLGRPTPEQKKVWNSAKKDMERFFYLCKPDIIVTDYDAKELDHIIERNRKRNLQLTQVNSKLQLTKRDQRIPVEPIDDLLSMVKNTGCIFPFERLPSFLKKVRVRAGTVY